MDAIVVLFLAFASCKCKRAWLPFIQAAFKKQKKLRPQWPCSADSRCNWFCGYVTSPIDTAVTKMIGDAPTKPERKSKTEKEKSRGIFISEPPKASERFRKTTLCKHRDLLKPGAPEKCQHLKPASGVSNPPWPSFPKIVQGSAFPACNFVLDTGTNFQG